MITCVNSLVEDMKGISSETLKKDLEELIMNEKQKKNLNSHKAFLVSLHLETKKGRYR